MGGESSPPQLGEVQNCQQNIYQLRDPMMKAKNQREPIEYVVRHSIKMTFNMGS